MTARALEVVPRGNGYPTVLIMPRFGWSSHCGKWSCAHERCIKARERAYRRCAKCGEQIKAGLPFIEHRNAPTGDLVSQEHVQCPVK